jgi:hypothetical protein
MSAIADIKEPIKAPPWPRDLKVFALLSALWAASLTARIVARDVAYFPDAPLQALFLGFEFDGLSARFVIIAEAAVFFVVAIGIAAERKSGLVLALIYLLEVVVGELNFMLMYMGDLSQGHNIRVAGVAGIISVLILLYLWIRSRDLLLGENPRV